MSKTVIKELESKEQNEGMGAKVRRSIGIRELKTLDPFLLLDEFTVALPAGFPDHPHRGFETVTYMLEGSFRHEDFCGHKGIIEPGDLQWMTAGRGIVHCEMPHGKGVSHGLQLWVNLHSTKKMVEPKYQELRAKDIPVATNDGVTVKIIAGEAFGVKSEVYTHTPAYYLDFTMNKNSHLSQPIPPGWCSFVYILEGTAHFGPEESRELGKAHHILVLSQKEDRLEVLNKDSVDCHFILVAGEPLNENVAQQGPFVMNTTEQIQEAISDYQRNRNGFENAKNWASS